MRSAIDETNRRREKQLEHNRVNGIQPETIEKEVKDLIDGAHAPGTHKRRKGTRARAAEPHQVDRPATEIDVHNPSQVSRELRKLERQMQKHASNLEFEHAARVRDQINELKEIVFVSNPSH